LKREASQASVVAGDQSIPIRPGDTLAACLMRAGRLALRRTRRGEPRGVYCGIGICNDCLATVDGTPNVRACMTIAQPGMIVTFADDGR
jgi:aerobic-type carbon monoxide dehydrogenase small subunit (CoxS/CutS family)